jgi:CelD/BcsL family acetyltransferase involved in cellulose biosynthesis
MLHYRLTKPSKLTRLEWNLWDKIQREQPELESPYFRPEFTQAVAAERDDVEVTVIENDGTPIGFFPFQRGAFNLGKPIGGKLNDFHGVIAPRDVQINAADLVASSRLSSWDFDHLINNQSSFQAANAVVDESPYLDLTHGFKGYCEERKKAGTDIVRKTISRGRKFLNEVGPMQFEWNTRNETVLSTLIRWKVEQFHRTGFMNLFAFPWTEALLRRIASQQTPGLSSMLSVLWNGDKPLAIAYVLRSFHVAHAWFVAYDQAYATYSPGMVLFLKIAEEAERQGVTRIHLGAGDQRFKQSLASGTVPVTIGAIESRSVGTLVRHAWRYTRDTVSNTAWLSFLQKPAALLQPVRSWMAFR